MTPPTLDEILLGLLAEKPQHGYELLNHFHDSARLGRVWNLSTSQLYAVLKRLEAQAEIEGRFVETASAPARTEYHLTASGRSRLNAWLDEPHPSASIRRIRVEFMSRLYIAWLLGYPTEAIIRQQRVAVQHQWEELAAQRESAQPGMDSLALELLLAQLDAVLTWIDRLERAFMPRETAR